MGTCVPSSSFAIVTNAALAVKNAFWVLPSIHLGTELLDHMEILCLIAWGTATVFLSSCTILLSHQKCKGLLFLHIFTSACYFVSLTVVILIEVRVSWFDLHFPNDSDVEHLFLCLLAIYNTFFIRAWNMLGAKTWCSSWWILWDMNDAFGWVFLAGLNGSSPHQTFRWDCNLMRHPELEPLS